MRRKKKASTAKPGTAAGTYTAPSRRNVWTPQVTVPHRVDIPLVANTMDEVVAPPQAGAGSIAGPRGVSRHAR